MIRDSEWYKSSYSSGQGGACVEVADLPNGGRGVRDSKDPAGAHLMFTGSEWSAFTAGIRNGQFD
jgi:hypothetical protein